jgi:WD40 repeat protein
MIRVTFLLVCFLVIVPLANAQESQRGDIRDLAWSPDGALLAVLADHGIWFYNAADWDSPPKSIPLVATYVRNLVFSPDGQIIAVGGGTGIQIWNVETHQLALEIEVASGHVLFSPDGSDLFVVRNSVEKYDVETGEQVSHFGDDYWSVWALTISPDGRWLVEGNGEEGGHVWDLETETLVTDIRAYFTDLDFSPDGTQVAVGGHYGEISFWNISTQEITTIETGMEDRVTDITFNPAGALLAAIFQDGMLLLANPETGEILETVQAHHPPENNVIDGNGLEFSPDGTLLATGGDDGVVHVWQIGESLTEPDATLTGYTPTDQL